MKGDFSRKTFDPRKRYSGVLMQQGRVQLDADWNEQLEIQHYRTETEARDVIGAAGVPKGMGDGFKIEPVKPEGIGHPTDLAISGGRIYVDGLLCELDATTPVPITFVEGHPNQASVSSMMVDGRAFDRGQWVELTATDKPDAKLLRIEDLDDEQNVLTFDADISDYQNSQQPVVRRVLTYLTQPDYPSPPFSSETDSDYPNTPPQLQLGSELFIAYLHVWEQHVTALDDALIREKALGGPDTTTRIKNVWQIELLAVDNPNDDSSENSDEIPNNSGEGVDCQTAFPEWDALVAPSTGLLNARTQAPVTAEDPCLLPPSAGYRRLENQLYRVEVQKGGSRNKATFKWSRENGSIQTAIEKVDGATLTVSSTGQDATLGFASGDWVELVTSDSELKDEPRPLALINEVNPDLRQITLDATVADLAQATHLKLRRWDQTGDAATADAVAMTDDWMDLEGGIQVQFSEGAYRSGDYWLIPARTATGEIEWPPYSVPNINPLAQSPVGIKHHYCRLALLGVNDGIISVLDDCRTLFPPLTHICAEDVCFDNTECDMPNVETVQDAIERLCSARDLRFHNKHLHGWGIVCGLQVNCGPDESGSKCRHVTVRSGYALDCEGNDIVHERDESFDLIEMIHDYNMQFPNAPLLESDGEICLVLTGDASRPYELEKYDPKWNSASNIFKNTLLMDFYNDCLKGLIKSLKEELTPAPDEANLPVGPTQKRITTLFNLLIQLFNQTNGRYVYLSGEAQLDDLKTEHSILKNFYENLRALLQSHTFCAQFDDAPFPEYPFSHLNNPTTKPPYIPTIFGKGAHQRLRVHPQGRLAYTVGAGDTINVYDLVANEMTAELKFPDAAAEVRDVAFSKDGKQLYAVATVKNMDSIFAVADISGNKLNWRNQTIICNVKLVTLATSSTIAGKVYAIGEGKGLYELNVQNILPDVQPLHAFNAVGHLVIAEQATIVYAFATSRANGTPDLYDQVRRFDLHAPNSSGIIFSLLSGATGGQLFGEDDIAIAVQSKSQRLFVVANPFGNSENKQLLIFTKAFGTTAGPVTSVDLEENTDIRLAFNDVTQNLMLSYADTYRVRLLDDKNQLNANFRQPVQVSPASMALALDPLNQDRKRVYVLNNVSKTITSIPAEAMTPSRQMDMNKLSDYRSQVLEAFVKLFGGLLQYLKDCFCDHLLVNCPECDPDDKLYLACISIRDGAVYKICNFSRRKYVRSFPTVEYWLSIVPIIPLVTKVVESFCCAVLPDLFGGYKASQSTQASNKLSSKNMYTATSAMHGTNFAGMFSKVLGQSGQMGSRLARDWMVSSGTDREKTPGVTKDNIVGMSVDDATTVLRQNNIEVAGVQNYNSSNPLANLLQSFAAPNNLEKGSSVILVEEGGTVRHYTTTANSGSAPGTGEVRAEITKVVGEDSAIAFASRAASSSNSSSDLNSLQAEMSALREEFTAAQKNFEMALGQRDATIAKLQTQAEGAQESLKVLAELQEQVKAVSTRTKRKSPRKTDDSVKE